MADLAYAVLLEQYEGDARAAAVMGDASVHESRERLDEQLTAPVKRGKTITADEMALRRGLGVAS